MSGLLLSELLESVPTVRTPDDVASAKRWMQSVASHCYTLLPSARRLATGVDRPPRAGLGVPLDAPLPDQDHAAWWIVCVHECLNLRRPIPWGEDPLGHPALALNGLDLIANTTLPGDHHSDFIARKCGEYSYEANPRDGESEVVFEGWDLRDVQRRLTYKLPLRLMLAYTRNAGRAIAAAYSPKPQDVHGGQMEPPKAPPVPQRGEVVMWIGAEYSKRNVRLARTRSAYLEAHGNVEAAMTALEQGGHGIGQSTFYDHLKALDSEDPDWRSALLVSGVSGNPENGVRAGTRGKSRAKSR